MLVASTAVDEIVACDRERVFKEVVAYFGEWKMESADIKTWHVETGWHDLPSKGQAHYRVRVLVGVAPNCTLKLNRIYQSCSWAGTDSDPKCNKITIQFIRKTAKFSKLAKRAVEFDDSLMRGLNMIAEIR